MTTPSLFLRQTFTLHSGGKSDFKLECDALSDDDLKTLAFLVSRKIKFSHVYGVPRGGMRFQEALQAHLTPDTPNYLIVDDVLTTGGSMEVARQELIEKSPHTQIFGLVIFARGPLPYWIKSIFHLDSLFWQND